MALSCAKEYSIAISTLLNPAAWWTMESPDPMIDVVAGSNMPLTLGALPMISAAGKVNLAETTNGDSDFARFKSTQIAALRPLGNDINLVGWSRLDNSAVPNSMQQFVSYTGSTWPNTLTLTFIGNGVYRVTFGITVLIVGVIPLGAFFFWNLRVDAATGDVYFSINNGVPVSAASATPTGALATAEVVVQFGNGGAPPYFQQLDELALFTTNLSAADLASIYNGGAGRTFP